MGDSKKKSSPERQVPIGPVFVPESLRIAAKATSAKTGVSISHVLREAVRAWVKSEAEKGAASQ